MQFYSSIVNGISVILVYSKTKNLKFKKIIQKFDLHRIEIQEEQIEIH